jgi:hypothetical protein
MELLVAFPALATVRNISSRIYRSVDGSFNSQQKRDLSAWLHTQCTRREVFKALLLPSCFVETEYCTHPLHMFHRSDCWCSW